MNIFLRQLLRFWIPFTVGVLLIMLPVELLLRNIPNDYSFKKNQLEKNTGHLKVLFIGNSHILNDINPEFISKPSFNAAYVSQTLEYDYAILEKYKDRLDNLEYIVLSVDYCNLYETMESSIEKWRAKNYKIYYGINLHPFSNLLKIEVLSNNPLSNWKRISNYYLEKRSSISCSPLGYGLTNNSKFNLNVVATGLKAAKRHTIKDTGYVAENLSILQGIINIARAKKIKLVFITSPAHESYYKNLDSVQLNNVISKVALLQKEHPDVFYFNFLKDTTFKKADFFDGDHLNEKGAEKFSHKIDSVLSFLSGK